MRLATFNVNGVNRRLGNLLDWLAETKPDAVCLQELKSTDEDFPHGTLREAGYAAVCHGQKTWNGVAILARGDQPPVVTRRGLPGDPADHQSRYIEAAVDGVLVACLYLPNGNPWPGPKFDYKLTWFERLIAHAATLHATGLPVALVGDFNVVPTDADIYPSKSWNKNALLRPESRVAFRRLLDQGWTDAIRARHPIAAIYTAADRPLVVESGVGPAPGRRRRRPRGAGRRERQRPRAGMGRVNPCFTRERYRGEVPNTGKTSIQGDHPMSVSAISSTAATTPTATPKAAAPKASVAPPPAGPPAHAPHRGQKVHKHA